MAGPPLSLRLFRDIEEKGFAAFDHTHFFAGFFFKTLRPLLQLPDFNFQLMVASRHRGIVCLLLLDLPLQCIYFRQAARPQPNPVLQAQHDQGK